MLGLIIMAITWGLTTNAFITVYAGLMAFAFTYAQRMQQRHQQFETVQSIKNRQRHHQF